MLRKLILGIVTVAMLAPSAGLLMPAAAAPPLQPGQIPTDIIVGFHKDIPADITAWASARSGTEVLRDEVLHWVSFHFPDQDHADQALMDARLRADVRYVEHDALATVQFTPNDSLYGSEADWPAINAPAAWDLARGDHSVKVAVVDTGIYAAHPDLAVNHCGPDASFVAGETPLTDLFGHGSHVAGTIAAVQNNALGVTGAGQSCLMSVQVCNRGGSCPYSGDALGIRWAVDHGAQILSMSWGGSSTATALGDAVFYAHSKGALLVAAAGNSGCNGFDTTLFPAKYIDVMAVAALSEDGTSVAGFSSCGQEVEIAAPGTNVLSTMRPCVAGVSICSTSGYGRISGTSMATPHVSGIAGLVKSAFPGLDLNGLRCVLDLSATDMGGMGHDINTGWGRLNARGALDEAASLIAQLGGVQQVNIACAAIVLAYGPGVPDTPTCVDALPVQPVRPCEALPL